MGVASVLSQVVGYVLSHIKRHDLREKRRPICVQHHKFPVLKKKGALQWKPQVCSFYRRETQNNTVADLVSTVWLINPFPPWFFSLVSHMANPRLDKETTSYHHCSWQTAASHPVRLINKHINRLIKDSPRGEFGPWGHAIRWFNSSGVLGSGRSKETVWSFALHNSYFETSSGTAAQLVFNKAVLIIYRCIHHRSSWHSNPEFLEQGKVVVTPVNPTWQHSNK